VLAEKGGLKGAGGNRRRDYQGQPDTRGRTWNRGRETLDMQNCPPNRGEKTSRKVCARREKPLRRKFGMILYEAIKGQSEAEGNGEEYHEKGYVGKWGLTSEKVPSRSVGKRLSGNEGRGPRRTSKSLPPLFPDERKKRKHQEKKTQNGGEVVTYLNSGENGWLFGSYRGYDSEEYRRSR